MERIAVGLALALAMMGACSKKGPKAGTERGKCYGNKSCNAGLVCLSDLCVRPPPADCEKVVTKLGGLTLSNWAPAKQRSEFRVQLLTVCKSAHLTEREGDCILGARNVKELRKCKKPLVLGDCKRMMDHVKKVIAAKDPKMLELLARENEATMLRECERRAMTKVDEACVLGAQSMDALKDCKLGM